MKTKTNDPKTTALTVYRMPPLQVALPLSMSLFTPTIDERQRAEVVAALARVLLEAAGVGSAEVHDDP